MDEMEEFLTVFFQECEERLGELQDNLALMVDGEWDAETLNAAFRAVHSVKGGAGAFGLDALVEFTHVFETLMDALRSDRLELTPQICQVLLRATDMMSALIEEAQGNGDADKQLAEKLRVELDALSKGEAPEEAARKAEGASEPEGGAPEAAAPAEPASSEASAPAQTPPAESAPAEPVAAEPVAEEAAGVAERDVVIKFAPGPDFIRSGHDPLKFIRALKQYGAVKAVAEGELPPLDEYDPLEPQLSWQVTLETAVDVGEIETFAIMYQLTADIEIMEASAPEAASAPEQPAAASEPAPAPAPVEPEPVASAPVEVPEPQAPAEPEPSAPPQAAAPAPEPAPEPAPAPAPEPKIEAPAPKADSSTKRGGGDSKPSAQQQRVSKALRVELSRIDRLVNMVGEIVITQAVLSQNFSDLDSHVNVDVGHAIEALSRQTRELQESVMAIRAQPVKSVFSRMPRVVRDLCASLNKDARIILSGEHTEVDTTVIEELSEPLTHMLRNSMDHGIEDPDKREAAGKPRTGTINLSAEHRGERVRIVIEDDGAGINRERVLQKAIEKGIVPPESTLSDEEIDMLIFHPGFSTAAQITNVSGRGVGMDVVKKKVQALGGRVTVNSNPGNGTRFVITLPLTLAVLDGMTIGVGNERFILPLSSVVEAVKLDDSNIDILPGEVKVMRYRGEWLPMICLESALNMETARSTADLVVVVETETEGRVAIIVDELLGQRQVVLKSLEANFRRVDGVSGATILGDGRVALILDIPALQALSGGGALAQEMMI